MTDDFLADLKRRHAERAAADRTFDLLGESLTHRPSVAPEVARTLEEAGQALADLADRHRHALNGGREDIPDEEFLVMLNEQADAQRLVLDAAEHTVLACLEADSHASWARLRSEAAASPLTADDVLEVARQLVVKLSQHPTLAPGGSSPGRKPTGAASRGTSSSTGRTRKR